MADAHAHSHEMTVLEHISAVTDYVSVPICFVVILSDAILMAAILMHRRLRTRSNYYLANFAACHVLYIMSTPVFYLVLDVFFDGYVTGRWHCVWIRVENFGIGLCLSFVACHGLDVTAHALRPRWFDAYRRRHLATYAALYLVHVVAYVASACVCLAYEFTSHFNLYLLTAYYACVCASVAYARCFVAQAQRAVALALRVCAVVLAMWLPLFAWYNFIAAFGEDRETEVVLWHTAFMAEFCAYSCPLAALWLLWSGDEQFRSAVRRVFGFKLSQEELDGLNVYESCS